MNKFNIPVIPQQVDYHFNENYHFNTDYHLKNDFQSIPVTDFNHTIVIPQSNENSFRNAKSYESVNQLAKDTFKNFAKREAYDISRKELTKVLMKRAPKVGKFATRAGFTANRFAACMYSQENLLIDYDIYSQENINSAYSYCSTKTLHNLTFSKVNQENNEVLKRLFRFTQFLEETPFEQRYNFNAGTEEMSWYNVNKLLHNTVYFTADKLNYIISPIENYIVEPAFNYVIEPIWDGVVDTGFNMYDAMEKDYYHTKYLIENLGVVHGLGIKVAEKITMSGLPELLTGNLSTDFDTEKSQLEYYYDYDDLYIDPILGEPVPTKKLMEESTIGIPAIEQQTNVEQPDVEQKPAIQQQTMVEQTVEQANVEQQTTIKQENVEQQTAVEQANVEQTVEQQTSVEITTGEQTENLNALELTPDEMQPLIMSEEVFGDFMNFSMTAVGIMHGIKNWDKMTSEQHAKWLFGSALGAATMLDSFRKDVGDLGCGAANILSKLLINGKLRVEEVAGFFVTEITNFYKVSLPFAVGTITNLVTALVTKSNIGKALCDLAADIMSITMPIIGQIYGIYKLLTGLLQLFNTCNVYQIKIMGIDATEVDEKHKNLILADDYYYTLANPFFDIEIKVHSCGKRNHMRHKQEALEEFKKQFKVNAYVCTGFNWENYMNSDKKQEEKTLYQQYVEMVLKEVLLQKWMELNKLTPDQITKLNNYYAGTPKLEVNLFDYLVKCWENWKKCNGNILNFVFPEKIVDKKVANYWDKHQGEDLISFFKNLYHLWKTGKAIEPDTKTMTPEEYVEFIISLNKNRTQQTKNESQQVEQQEMSDAAKGTGSYSREEIAKRANKNLLKTNTSAGTVAAVAASTVSGSMLYSVAYIDKEIETINYLGITNYLKGKIKGNVRMFFESYTSMLVSSHATLTFCLTEYSEKLSKEMLEDYVIPHLGLASSIFVSNATNWDMDIEDRIYYFFEGIFRTNIGKVITYVKNYYSITTSIAELVISKLTEYGIVLSSFFTTYIPVIASMLFYRFARKLIVGRNDIPPIAMVNTDIEKMIKNYQRLERFKKMVSFVKNKENGLTDRQIMFENIKDIQTEMQSKSNLHEHNTFYDHQVQLYNHQPELQDYSVTLYKH